MKGLIFSVLIMTIFASCNIFNRLNSETTIQPNDRFVLGNNDHGAFKVKLKNISSIDLEVYLTPINGGKHSMQIIKPSQSTSIKVEKNTALNIANNSSTVAFVNLKVTGDTGLSMGYSN